MRFFVPLIFLSFFKLNAAESTSSWNWHQQFPWVYSEAESDWHYWRAGADGQFYLWKDKDQTWYRFDTTKSVWISTLWDSYFSSSDSSSNKDDSSENYSWSWYDKDSSKEQTPLTLSPFLFPTTDSSGNIFSMSPPLTVEAPKSLCSLIFTALAEHPAVI